MLKICNIPNYPVYNRTNQFLPKKADAFDYFTKSNVNFTGRQENFQNKINAFSDKLEQYVLNGEISIDNVTSVVNEELSEKAEVKPFSELYKNIIAAPGTRAYSYIPIGLNRESGGINAIQPGKTIFVKLPENTDIVEKYRFISAMSHEYTHLCQHEEPEKSIFVLIDKYLKSAAVDDKTKLNTMQAAPIIFKGIEFNMNQALACSLQKTDALPKVIPCASEEILNQKIKSVTNMDTDNFIKTLMASCAANAEQKLGKIDRKFVKNYIKAWASNELEAYQRELKELKKLMNIHEETDWDLKIMLYKKLMAAVEN
ncbi:MAG: hypothetical protein LBK53_03885 [Heliobacteriaceae bacterium]|nr:hypothetical protein [Heliobacteriaceae bacterium]